MKSSSVAALAVSLLSFFPIANGVAVPHEEVTDAAEYIDPGIADVFIDPLEEDGDGELRKRQTAATGFTPVTGPINVGKVNRLSVNTLQGDTDAWNIFIWALYTMQNVAETNSLSYYQISGIHGLPYIPWQESSVSTQDATRGYCTHDSALFLTWHRPYLSLLEQRIVAHAVNEAAKFSGTSKSKYQTAAARVRLPYWDWASTDLKSAIPAIVMQPTVTVTKPGTNGAPQSTSIPNPLFSYKYTNASLRQKYFYSPYNNIQQTVRQPTSAWVSQNNVANTQMKNTYTARRQNVYNLFSIPSFREFSSTAWSANQTPNSWTSVESIHNEIHGLLGGQGHMSFLDYSAYDPIFWLHHCNVDRLGAMYQAIYPGRVITPQPAAGTFARKVSSSDVDTISTPLAPFRKANKAYWTSQDVSSASSIWTYNYGYPEVPVSMNGQSSSALKTFTTQKMNQLYAPSSSSRKRASGYDRREWTCHMAFNQADVQGTAEIVVSLGNVTSTPVNERKSKDEVLGVGASFGNYGKQSMNRMISASVPLTEALIANGIELDPKQAVPYLQKTLAWSAQVGTTALDLTKVPSLVVGVSSRTAKWSGNDADLPQYGEFETHYQITEQKQAGLKESQSDIVDSGDAPKVSISSSYSWESASSTSWSSSWSTSWTSTWSTEATPSP